jgi:phosphoglucomutase
VVEAIRTTAQGRASTLEGEPVTGENAVPQTIETMPFDGQKPGTSGLRKKVETFAQPHYAENFIQSVFDVVERPAGATLVIGGDGRYLNRTVIQTAIRMAAAAGVDRMPPCPTTIRA